MKKKLFAVFVCFIILVTCCAPAFASSFVPPDSGTVRRYYALIPFDTMSIRCSKDELSHCFSSAAYGQYIDKTTSSYDPGDWPYSDPAVSPTIVEQIGWDSDHVVFTLQYDFRTEYYSQPSNYYAAYNRFSRILVDDHELKTSQFSFEGRHFYLTTRQMSDLHNYARLYVSDSCSGSIMWTVSFYTLTPDGKNVMETINVVSNNFSVSGPSDILYVPTFAELFGSPNELNLINSGVVINNISCDVVFNSVPSDIGFGMLYASAGETKGSNMFVHTENETIIEKEVIKEVPTEDLDLFSWIINPISKFFNLELFPGISIGGIMGVLVIMLLVFLLIKIFGG